MPPSSHKFGVALLDPKTHDRAAFTCGEASLDEYLKRQANQDMKRRISTTYVMSPGNDPSRVAGFYTLSAFAVLLRDLPDALASKLPHHDRLPATLLGRLARDEEFKGGGLGELLLVDALARALVASERVGSHSVVVDALNEGATNFYLRYGFLPLTDDAKRLYLPMKSVAQMF